MTAVEERPAPAKQRQRRTIPATAVGHLHHPAEAAGFFGMHVLQTHCQLFGQAIEAGDVISVDFDIRRIDRDADFLVSFNYGRREQWFGVRRFHFLLDGSLQIAEPDGWGYVGTPLKWHPCTREILDSITVFGMVREVFKPVSKMRFRHG